MKDIRPILVSLGLMESEIKTYRAAFEYGSLTVIDLAKKTKLSRQAVYVAINSLIDRGLMTSMMQGKKKFFAAEHPKKLLAYAQRKNVEMQNQIEDLERVVPQLELQMGGERPIVRVFEGKEGLKAFIEDMRSSTCKDSYEITDTEALYNVIHREELGSLRSDLKKNSIKIHGIYSGPVGQNVVESNRYLLPVDKGGFKSNVGIYGDKIHLITFEGKMYSVMLESKPLAKALTILFELAIKGMKK